MKHFLPLIFSCLLFRIAVAQETYPVNGSHDKRPGLFAFTHANIVVNADKTLKDATLLIHGKTIEAVGQVNIPKGYAVIDLKGRYIYPSLIDAFTGYGVPEAETGGGRMRRGERSQVFTRTEPGAYAWNEAIRPESNAKSLFAADAKQADELRKLGFGVVNSVIRDGIARGTSSVVTLADDKENELIIRGEATANYSFSKGSSKTDYPSSQMGAIALLRQTYYDADWYKKQASEEYNISLAEFNRQQDFPQFFEVSTAQDVLRADRIGDEFGKQYVFVTGGEEYKLIGPMKTTGGKFIIPLSFPKAFDVEDPADARNVSFSQLKSWELAPTNPAAVEKAGLTFAITTNGLESRRDFWTNLQQALDNGLSRKAALRALTETPASLLGISASAGSLDKGKLANFIITSTDLFEKENVIYENWVQGKPYTVTRMESADLRGNYALSIDGLEKYQVRIGGKPGSYEVTVRSGGDSSKNKAAFSRTGDLVSLAFDLKGNNAGRVRLTGYIVPGDQPAFRGEAAKPDGSAGNWSATFASANTEASTQKKEVKTAPAGSLVYPLVAYGWKTAPQQETVLFKNATVWTNEQEGILQQADVLISGGKIKSVGKNLSAAGAKVIDATGKHLTPGIIDEHSHIAISNGINEGTQSVTSEVRIGDIIDAEDINIYRQLAGGVTTSHILHGSANTIGGQTQLIKLRWGKTPEEMKFAGWGGFIKFALGENVKQSNWGGNNLTRFPQTRMGVEQVLYDAFTRAQEYQKNRGKKGSTTRRDLELDALVEIMEGKRNITCHSYVQSEINMLMHVADSMKFKVNTFTHILEGYKVADKMKQRGINASTFSDWWAYKMEVQDAIPYNGAIMTRAGLNVAFNSDDAEMARRLNQEAGKAVKYGGISEEEALKFVTINPAKMLHIDAQTGSLKPGKDADIVLWSDNPLSIYAHAEKTYVDGIAYWDEVRDKQTQQEMRSEESRIIQKMIAAKKDGGPVQPARMRIPRLYHCDTLEDRADEESDVFTHYLHNRLFNHH
ncbi:MAG: amidohydrolase family protein [Mucilaginibacter polytrichastri]|nr:amidohydrolase family protein [Mucilaginibacter polytrichastri]